MFGVEKHLKVLIVQPYYKYFIFIIIRFIQEIQKIRSNIQKRIQRKDYLKKEILFFGKVMLLCV
jgi:hypothetical protein